MKKCKCCGRPLSDFEVKFHAEAHSPDSVSGKCWDCSHAADAFDGADVENKGHKKQITVVIACAALCFLLFLPLLPYLDSYELPLLLDLYSGVAVLLCIALGAIAFYPILTRFLAKRKESALRIDPPEQRYGTSYSPVTTHYEAKERFDGTFVFNKVTRGGESQVDRWEWRGASNEKVDGLLGAYGNLIEKVIYLAVLAFFGAAFIFWAIPYLAYAVVKDKMSAERRAKIPADLQKAYNVSRAAARPMPLSYHDKVGFLVSCENCAKAPAKSSGDRFLSNFKTEESKKETRLPFFFKRYGGTAYMIVDYKEGGRLGTSFVLVKDGKNPIEKRIVIGRSFADTDPTAWEEDYKALGASSRTVYSMAWYEEKMDALMKDSRKEILG